MSPGPGGARRTSLFEIREPRRRFGTPLVAVVLLHAALIAWASRAPGSRPSPPPPIRVALRLPIRRVEVQEPAGGGPKLPPRPPHRAVRRRVQPPPRIPPPVVEAPPPPPAPEPIPGDVEDDDEEGDLDTEADLAVSGGGGNGSGTGPVEGPGHGSIKSKTRGAWLTHTDWRCTRPGHEDLGRIVVRIRVQVLLDGKPGPIEIVRAGPEVFNRRAVECARDETYLPALDPEGRPILGAAEFGIEFLN